jgi:hypothetical protein
MPRHFSSFNRSGCTCENANVAMRANRTRKDFWRGELKGILLEIRR